MPPGEFWEQVPDSFNAAMRGALAARREHAEMQRDLALMTAYFGGNLAQADWKAVPAWREWLDKMTRPKQPRRAAEVIARFRAMAERGFVREVKD